MVMNGSFARAYSGAARAANSVLPSPLRGGSAHAGKLAQPAQAWLRCAGVGVVRRPAEGPPPPTPPRKGEGSTPSVRRDGASSTNENALACPSRRDAARRQHAAHARRRAVGIGAQG